MQTVPLNPVPSQSLSVTLNGQAAQIAVYQLGTPPDTHLYLDLLSAGAPIVTCRICRGYGGQQEMTSAGLANTTPVLVLADAQYQGFAGDFMWIDTQASPTQQAADPQASGLGDRWQLVYLSPADLEAAGIG